MPSEAGAREIGKSNPHFAFRCAYDLQNHFLRSLCSIISLPKLIKSSDFN